MKDSWKFWRRLNRKHVSRGAVVLSALLGMITAIVMFRISRTPPEPPEPEPPSAETEREAQNFLYKYATLRRSSTELYHPCAVIMVEDEDDQKDLEEELATEVRLNTSMYNLNWDADRVIDRIEEARATLCFTIVFAQALTVHAKKLMEGKDAGSIVDSFEAQRQDPRVDEQEPIKAVNEKIQAKRSAEMQAAYIKAMGEVAAASVGASAATAVSAYHLSVARKEAQEILRRGKEKWYGTPQARDLLEFPKVVKVLANAATFMRFGTTVSTKLGVIRDLATEGTVDAGDVKGTR